MKIIYLFFTSLCLSFTTYAQIRIISIDPEANEFTIKNFGRDSEKISTYRLSIINVNYDDLTSFTIVNGDLNLDPGNTVVLTPNSDLGENGYIALYLPFSSMDGELNDPDFLVDYVQWKLNGYEFEMVAVSKGIWKKHTFIDGDPIYSFTGNGEKDYGAEFWKGSTPASKHINIRFTYVDPSTNKINIKNFGANKVDISSYRLCSKTQYTNNLTSQTILAGNLNLMPDSTVTIALSGFGGTLFDLDTSKADMALYVNNNYADTASLLDFMQWGGGGNEKENIAVSKNIWSKGEFVLGKYPYQYFGNATQHGASFWLGDTTVKTPNDNTSENEYEDDTNTYIQDIQNTFSFNIYPNPVTSNFFRIEVSNETEKLSKIQLFNMSGNELLSIIPDLINKVVIHSNNLSSGLYILRVSVGDMYYDKKVLVY